MLDEKTMVSDALAGVNGELVRYGEMISQTENKELKQCLKQIRNQCEIVSGKALSGCQRKKLLCSGCQSIPAGNQSRKICINRIGNEIIKKRGRKFSNFHPRFTVTLS